MTLSPFPGFPGAPLYPQLPPVAEAGAPWSGTPPPSDIPAPSPTGTLPVSPVPITGDVMGLGSNGRTSPTFDASGSLLAQIQSWTRADMDRWSPRNERFQTEQEMYELAPPQQMPRNAQNLVTLNDPRVLVNKVARILASHPNMIDIPAKPGVDPVVAQKMENWCYDYDRALNTNWAMTLANPYRYDQAMLMVLRGWLSERTMILPENARAMSLDPTSLFDHQIIDPACVYPYKAGGKIRRVTHAYHTNVGDMVADPLLRDFLDPDWYEQDERSLCHVTAVYWQSADGGWYHAIIGGVGPGSGLSGNSGMWIKPPMELGYNPWTVVLSGGASYRETPWDDQQFISQVGTGILNDSAENQKYINRMVTRLNELLAQESNPAATVYTAAGQVKRIELFAGGRNFLMEKDKLELHRVGPSIPDFQNLYEIFKDRARRSGLPDIMFGDFPTGQNNSMAASVIMAASRDIFFPFVESLNATDANKFKLHLELYRDFGPGSPLTTKMPAGNGMVDGLESMRAQISGNMMGGQSRSPFGAVQMATLDAYEITQQGTYIEVTREDMTPQEKAAQITLALSMVKDDVISRETARKDWVKLRNPAAENARILAEKVYLDPLLIQVLTPLVLSDTGQEWLSQLYSALRTGMPMGGGPGPSGGSTGGAPGAPTPGGPGNGSGMPPSQVMPPAMTMGPNTNQRRGPDEGMFQQMLSQLMGAAQGGAGPGGMPPNPAMSRVQRPPTPSAGGFF